MKVIGAHIRSLDPDSGSASPSTEKQNSAFRDFKCPCYVLKEIREEYNQPIQEKHADNNAFNCS